MNEPGHVLSNFLVLQDILSSSRFVELSVRVVLRVSVRLGGDRSDVLPRSSIFLDVFFPSITEDLSSYTTANSMRTIETVRDRQRATYRKVLDPFDPCRPSVPQSC